MGILAPVIIILAYLALTLMDIAIACHVVRILSLRFRGRLLQAFAQVGAPIVDEVTGRVRGLMERLFDRPIGDAAGLFGSLLLLLIAREAVALVFRSAVRQ